MGTSENENVGFLVQKYADVQGGGSIAFKKNKVVGLHRLYQPCMRVSRHREAWTGGRLGVDIQETSSARLMD